MKNLSLLFITSFVMLMLSCSDDEGMSPAESFQYTVSGAASGTISGSQTNFGISNGELFISLTSGTDVLVLRVLIDPAASGSYNVNPILVNQQAQAIEDGDAFADLNLGSIFSGNQRDFSTNAGNGGTLTLTSTSANMIVGTFSMSLLELLGGGQNQPEINIQGEFTAIK